jgi:hypothetical protein
VTGVQTCALPILIKAARLGNTRFVVKNGVNTVGINTDTINNAITVNGGADFSGNVGIGIAIPSTQLQVAGSSFSLIRVSAAADNVAGIDFGTVASPDISRIRYNNSTNSMSIRVNSIDAVNISSGGNLGLGITPSPWFSTWRAIEIGGADSNVAGNGTGPFRVLRNVYLDTGGSWRYVNSDLASFYQQTQGVHSWWNAPSGIAGGYPTFTQAMTLFSNGNLAVGPTTDAGFRLDVNGTGRFSGTGLNASVRITNTTASTGKDWNLYSLNNGNFGLYNNTDGLYSLISTPSGNVGIGTSDPQSQFVVGKSGNNSTLEINLNNNGYSRIFSYNRSGTTSTNLILQDPGGNVGIGTTSPDERLTIGSGNGISIRTSASGTYGSIKFGTNNSSFHSSWAGISSDWEGVGINVSNLVFYTALGNAATERMRITSGGTVVVASLGTGTVFSNGGILTNTNPSDERLKDDVADLQYGLNEILQLRPVSYNWKNDTINQGKQFGFIAQEVQEVMPELISEFETKDGEEDVIRLGLDKEAIFVTLVAAIQELTARLEILENK